MKRVIFDQRAALECVNYILAHEAADWEQQCRELGKVPMHHVYTSAILAIGMSPEDYYKEFLEEEKLSYDNGNGCTV